MEEVQVGPGMAFLAIFLIFMGIVSVFFSGMPPILPVVTHGPPAEILVYNRGGALMTEVWLTTRLNQTTRIFFRVFHTGDTPQVVTLSGSGSIAQNCIINASPQLSWVMQPQTYELVEVAATPLGKAGVGEFQIIVVTDYEGE